MLSATKGVPRINHQSLIDRFCLYFASGKVGKVCGCQTLVSVRASALFNVFCLCWQAVNCVNCVNCVNWQPCQLCQLHQLRNSFMKIASDKPRPTEGSRYIHVKFAFTKKFLNFCISVFLLRSSWFFLILVRWKLPANVVTLLSSPTLSPYNFYHVW